MTRYYVEAFDDLIDDNLQKKVWQHILAQSFHATRKDVSYPTPGTIINYIPSENKKEYLDDSFPSVNNQYMHRCVFAKRSDDLSNHPIILELWNKINTHFNNEFEIKGDPEGIADNNYNYARVYVNAQPQETIKRTHGVHRDTIDLDETKHYTMLYIANPEWYPTWFAENVFYEDNEQSEDKQQYQKGFGQSRGFGIGEPYLTIRPKSGRIILYDGRTLHTTKPAAPWSPEMRYALVFRLRKIK